LDNEELICALISEQARSRIADEQLGIAAVRAKHLDWLVPSLVADFQKRHATLHCAGYKATPQTVRTKGLHVEAEPTGASLCRQEGHHSLTGCRQPG
jgi:hypothetical protein